MKRSKFTEEQVAYVLRQAESGTAVEDICRSMSISQATFYFWKKKYGELGASEVRRLRQLEGENLRLKRLVAALTLDKSSLQEVIKKRFNTFAPTYVGAIDSADVRSGNWIRVQLSETFINGVVLRCQQGLSRGFAHADKRDRKRSSKVWLQTNTRHAAARRLEYQYQTSALALSPRRAAGQDATRAKETFESAQRYAASSYRLERELKHGFCA